MDISVTGLELIESFEGYSYNAYWDRYGRVWTVGYGETQGVGPNSTMTRGQAQADLQRRVTREYEPAIRGLNVPLNQNQWDALCSFVWNLGPGSMRWDIGRALQRRDYHGAADDLLRYTTAGGLVLAGLVRRRWAERKLFLTPPPAPPNPHHYERYPNVDVRFNRKWGGHIYLNEFKLVTDYDRLRRYPGANRAELLSLQRNLKAMADRVYAVAHWSNPPAWGERWRGWRYQELVGRSKGILMA